MSDLRIIVTGGRKRDSLHDYALLDEKLDDIHEVCRGMNHVIIQGGCPDGVDAMARRLARDRGAAVETYPADFQLHPEDAVEVSNQTMVDQGAYLCLAFPNDPADGPSLGTWDMVRRAVAAGIETRIYPEAAS